MKSDETRALWADRAAQLDTLVHECQFYPHHRANGPPEVNIYCEQCICGVPHGDPETFQISLKKSNEKWYFLRVVFLGMRGRYYNWWYWW